jgi:hypothetical protein
MIRRLSALPRLHYVREMTTAYVISANEINKASLPHRDTVSTMMLLLNFAYAFKARKFYISKHLQ